MQTVLHVCISVCLIVLLWSKSIEKNKAETPLLSLVLIINTTEKQHIQAALKKYTPSNPSLQNFCEIILLDITGSPKTEDWQGYNNISGFVPYSTGVQSEKLNLTSFRSYVKGKYLQFIPLDCGYNISTARDELSPVIETSYSHLLLVLSQSSSSLRSLQNITESDNSTYNYALVLSSFLFSGAIGETVDSVYDLIEMCMIVTNCTTIVTTKVAMQGTCVNPELNVEKRLSAYNRLFTLSKSIHHRVLPFLQYNLLSLLSVVSPSAQNNAVNHTLIQNLLKEIEPRYLQEAKLDKPTKCLSLFLSSQSVKFEYRLDGVYNRENNRLLVSYHPVKNIHLQYLSIHNNTLFCSAKDDSFLPSSIPDCSYYVQYNNKRYMPEYQRYPLFDIPSIVGTYKSGRLVRFTIPLEKTKTAKIHFFYQYKNDSTPLTITLGKFACIPPCKSGYCKRENHLFRASTIHLTIYSYSLLKHIIFEILYCIQLMMEKKKYLLPYRLLYWLSFLHKPIWLFYDRGDIANDNSEHFFRYVNNRCDKVAKQYNYYYCISRKSKDFIRLQEYGKVLELGSFKHKLFCLLADVVIDAYANEDIINPFRRDRRFVVDLLHYEYVFIQHGITKDDVSGWLHQFDRNFQRFIVAAYPEYQSMLAQKYGLSTDIVRLLGFPRHDHLYNGNLNNQQTMHRQLLILPTYRRNIYLSLLHHNESHSMELFKKSDFYCFWNSLINSTTLKEELRKRRTSAIFCLHPNFQRFWKAFLPNDYVTINSGFAEYQSIFLTSSLIVTDFSSVAFEMAYIHKPIIYAQYDRNTFFKNHVLKEGYFNYSRHGFGPITTNISSTIQEIVRIIDNNWATERIYQQRLEHFFAYHDNNNCRRLFDDITHLWEHRRHRIGFPLIAIVLRVSLFLQCRRIFLKIRFQHRFSSTIQKTD